MERKEKWAWSLFSLFIGMTVLLYLIAFFTHIGAVRQLHRDYTKGFLFQKECKDEYTEQESTRKWTYDAIIHHRQDLSFGDGMNVYVLLWVPLVLCALCIIYMKEIHVKVASGNMQAFYGYFFVGITVTVILLAILHKIGIDRTSEVRLFTFLTKKNCNLDDVTDIQINKRVQGGLLFVMIVLVIAFFMIQRLMKKWTSDPNSNIKPFGFSEVFFNKTTEFNYLVYAIILLWFMSWVWISTMTRFYGKLQDGILCYYPEQIATYKELLRQYVQDEQKFEQMKTLIEQNYFRIHMSYPNVNQNNIDDYVYYLMHFKGRELEHLEEGENTIADMHLTNLRNIMLTLRTNKMYKTTLFDFLKWCAFYFILQFVIVIYILFHAFYTRFQIHVSYIVILGSIMLAFALSWYSWFDTVLVA